jgi:hypothetical protein
MSLPGGHGTRPVARVVLITSYRKGLAEMPGETLVVTWMDGKVAVYSDIEHRTSDGWLIIYQHSRVLWRFPRSNIRAVGNQPWRPDETIHSTSVGSDA